MTLVSSFFAPTTKRLKRGRQKSRLARGSRHRKVLPPRCSQAYKPAITLFAGPLLDPNASRLRERRIWCPNRCELSMEAILKDGCAEVPQASHCPLCTGRFVPESPYRAGWMRRRPDSIDNVPLEKGLP
jgi:hypothetical protein